MADGEDFTFPATTANPPPCSSPPLWRPVSRPENPESLKYDEVEAGNKFKLCSCQECKARNNITSKNHFWINVDNDDREEKMDLLWENLDEKNTTKAEGYENLSPGKNVQICCVGTLKLSKGNGDAINGFKASFLVLIRFLMKKAFFMHSSGGSIKKLAW